MSLEVFGDEGHIAPEGYVSEDVYEELELAYKAAMVVLQHAKETCLETRAMEDANARIETMMDSITSNIDYHRNEYHMIPRP